MKDSADNSSKLLKVGVFTGAMLIIGWLVAPTLSNWHSHQLAGRLMLRLDTVDDADSKVLLRQLAELGEPAIAPLITAASSERNAVASVARQILEEKLATWELTLKTLGTKVIEHEFADQTETFAKSLANRIHYFGPAGKQWAERQALRMIDFAGRLPSKQTVTVLEDCSNILAAVPPRSPRLRTVTQQVQPLKPMSANRLTAPNPQVESLTHASEGSLEIFARIESGMPKSIPSKLVKVVEPQRIALNSPPSSQLDWSPSAKSQQQALPTQPNANPTEIKSLATKPITDVNDQIVDIPTPDEMATKAESYRLLSDDKLIVRLRSAEFHDSGIIRSILHEREYNDAELAIRLQLDSPIVDNRLRLVEEATQLPATSAARVLRQLLGDESGDVRLRALTALATTNAPDLHELAHKVAIHDKDPRVAKFASRLLKQKR